MAPKATGIKNYGVWSATPVSYKAEKETDDSRSPHLTLYFEDGSSTTKSAAINVKSLSSDSRLVYWMDANFQHPLTESLLSIDQGFHFIPDRTNSNTALVLDYQRINPPILNFNEGLLLPHDVPGANNDILDELIPLVERAIASPNCTVYVFGSSYKTGIHDVHMNQGSLPKFDNGVGQDGGLVFHFKDDDHFEAVFLAFASQRVPTDDNTGLALGDSRPLSEIARSVVVEALRN